MGRKKGGDSEVSEWEDEKYRPVMFIIVGSLFAILVYMFFETPQISKIIFVTALIFAFHDHFSYIFKTLYQQALETHWLKDLPVVDRPISLSIGLIFTEIFITTPLAVSSQYQTILIDEIFRAAFGVLMFSLLFGLLKFQFKIGLDTVNGYIGDNWDLTIILFIMGLFHLQMAWPNSTSIEDCIGIAVAVIIVLPIGIILLFSLSLIMFPIIIIIFIILPFTVPLRVQLPLFMDKWAILSLLVVSLLFVIYYRSGILKSLTYFGINIFK